MSATDRVYAAIIARDTALLDAALAASGLRLNDHVDDTTPLFLAVHQAFGPVRHLTRQLPQHEAI